MPDVGSVFSSVQGGRIIVVVHYVDSEGWTSSRVLHGRDVPRNDTFHGCIAHGIGKDVGGRTFWSKKVRH